jgi:hypothetical protein
MTHHFAFAYASAVSLLLGLLAGCGPPEPDADSAPRPMAGDQATAEHADPREVPLTDAEIDQLRQETSTWAAAIDHVESYRDAIRRESTGVEPAKAHRPLDLLDHLLEWLPQIAQANDIPKENWQTIGEKAQELRDLFNEVHANIDAGRKPDYAAVSDRIDAAVAALAAIPSAAPSLEQPTRPDN